MASGRGVRVQWWAANSKGTGLGKGVTPGEGRGKGRNSQYRVSLGMSEKRVPVRIPSLGWHYLFPESCC